MTYSILQVKNGNLLYAVCLSGVFSETILAIFATEAEAHGYIEFLKEQEAIKNSTWAQVCAQEERNKQAIIASFHEAAEIARKEWEELQLQEDENIYGPR